MKNQHIHHHYHFVKTDYKLLRYFAFGILIVSWSCGLFLSSASKKLFSCISGWISQGLASYSKILNESVSIFGWKKSFLWFWYLHIGWGSLIYFGIPVLAISLLIFISKKEKRILSIILALYIWHHGLSFLIQCHNPWYFCLLALVLLSPWMINSFRKIALNERPLYQRNQQSSKRILDKLTDVWKLSLTGIS